MKAFFTNVEDDLVGSAPLVESSLACRGFTFDASIATNSRIYAPTVEVISKDGLNETSGIDCCASIRIRNIPERRSKHRPLVYLVVNLQVLGT